MSVKHIEKIDGERNNNIQVMYTVLHASSRHLSEKFKLSSRQTQTLNSHCVIVLIE